MKVHIRMIKATGMDGWMDGVEKREGVEMNVKGYTQHILQSRTLSSYLQCRHVLLKCLILLLCAKKPNTQSVITTKSKALFISPNFVIA